MSLAIIITTVIAILFSSYHCYKLNYVTHIKEETHHIARVNVYTIGAIAVAIIGAFKTVTSLWLIVIYFGAVFVITMAAILILKGR